MLKVTAGSASLLIRGLFLVREVFVAVQYMGNSLTRGVTRDGHEYHWSLTGGACEECLLWMRSVYCGSDPPR